MVKLQKLVLRNFKSFKKADIPISRGFTAIVGSNGSGKTNILDGLLFVLGISSMKMLRVSKINELVNSSAVENYAKVELSLKHGDKTYNMQRMIDKQGKCIYRLDGKRKTRNELSSLLLELGIKPEGHNIVVQGDTTRVIEMSPVERRQIIDELAGLQEFDSKKEEALKELQKVDNKLRDAGIVLQERENYLEQLRQDKEAASEFKSLQDESKKIKAGIIFSEIERIERLQKEAKEKIAAIEKERNQIEEKIAEKISEKTEAKRKAEELGKEILSRREKVYATVGAKLEEAKTKKALIDERIQNKKMLVEESRAKAEQLREKAKGIGLEIEEQNSRISEIESELSALEKGLKEARERKRELKGAVGQREEKLKEMGLALESLTSEFESENSKLFEKKSSLGLLEKEAGLKKEAMRETMQAIEELEAELAEKEKKSSFLAQLNKKFGSISEELEKAKKLREKNLNLLKEAQAEKRNLAESVEILKKSFATCPVCDSELEKQKKDAIAAKKESKLKEIMEREQKLKERCRESEQRLEEVAKAFEKTQFLEAATQGLAKQRQKLKQERERLSGLKKWLSENSEKSLKAEIESLSKKAGEKKRAMLAQKERVNAFSQSLELAEVQKAVEKLASLEREEDRLKHEKESLAESSEKHLLRRKKENLAEAEGLETQNRNASKDLEALKAELEESERMISGLEAKVAEAERQSSKMVGEKQALDSSLDKIEESIRQQSGKLKALGQQENGIKIESGKEEVRLADLAEESNEFKGIERAQNATQERLREVESKIQKLGAINMKAIESFSQLETEVQDVRKKVEKLDEERLAVVEMIEKIDVKRTNVFMECFEELGKNFSRMFSTLFTGEGFLELSDRENPLEAGLLIQAKHKGDAIRNIDSMSGGEKTMTALAFLFAIQLYEPAPFYVFDEADAALDKENSIKMAKIIKEISAKSQFIAITHNDPLVQEANQIIGVALNKQKSSVIGLKLKEK